MLSCQVNESYVEASKNLDRSLDFRCPVCGKEVILKAGSVYASHFSHKADLGCKHGAGETLWHRKGKIWAASYSRKNGCTANFETPLGDRRTDVHITTKTGKTIAIEFQKKDEGKIIYKRTSDLLKFVDEVIWVLPWKVSFIDNSYRATATYGINALYSKRHPVNAKIRFYDDKNDRFLSCKKYDWMLYVEATDFGGGYEKKAKRWCELVITKEF